MELRIQTGTVHVPIVRDGKETGELELNPRDVTFVEGFFDLVERYRCHIADYAEQEKALNAEDARGLFKLMNGISATIRESIDQLFGEGTAEAAFGRANDPVAFEQFFDGIGQVLEALRADAVATYLNEEDVLDESSDGAISD